MRLTVTAILILLMAFLSAVSFFLWIGNTRTLRLASVTAFVWACVCNMGAAWAMEQS